MPKMEKIALICRPEEEIPPAAGLFSPAPLAYRVGRDLRLYRARDYRPPRDSIMVLSCEAGIGAGPVSALSSDILRECLLKNVRGVLLDLPASPGPALSLLAGSLAASLYHKGLPLFLPHAPSLPPRAIPLLTSFPLSGDARCALLRRKQSPQGPFALNLRLRRRDLKLPERGTGQALREGDAEKILRNTGGGAFYSKELMAMYGSYTRGEESHMLLWDTAETLCHRLEDAWAAGAETVFLIWEELAPLWPRLRERLSQTAPI